MVANINNFGVVNFYESNTPKQEPSKKAEPICEDITPVEDLSSHSPESDSGPLSSAPDVRPENIIPIPKEGKYSQVREYIKERSRFDEEFKNFVKDKSLRELCARLTKEFGWYVDEHSLGTNLNRHRKD